MAEVAHSLFRQEALDARRENAPGEIVLALPVSFSLLTSLFLVVVVALVAYMNWGGYTRKTRVEGYLVPSEGLIKVHAPQAGILVEKLVDDGDEVRQGDALYVLSTESSSRETPEAQATAIAGLRQRRENLKSELSRQERVDEAEALELRARLRSMEIELTQLKAELAAQERRVASAQEAETTFRALLAEEFVAEVQAREKEEATLDQQQLLLEIRRDETVLRREIGEAETELSTFEPRAMNRRSEMEREISALDQELIEHESRRNTVITAPGAGTVTAVLAERGQYSGPEAPLLTIVPRDSRLKAYLLIPSRAIGFVESGQAVAIRYQAFPHQRFGAHSGSVEEIAGAPTTPDEASLPVAPQEPVYLAKVVLDSQSVQTRRGPVPLRPGMLLEADIRLDRRRIIEWVFEPLLGTREGLR